MIPKVIHYCWFGEKKLPEDAKRCIKSWKKKCPDFSIVEWNESNFDVNCHPFVKAAYEAKAWAFVTDYVRLKVIYENGGIYLDTDVRVLKDFSPLLNHPAFFGSEQLKNFVATGLGFGAEKGNLLVKALLKSYDTVNLVKDNLRNISCPRLNTNVFVRYGYVQNDRYQDLGVAVVYPPLFFDPLAPGSDKDLVCSDTYSIHLYNASWTPTKYYFKARIRRIIGSKNIIRIKRILHVLRLNK